jgi:hypothetical protein
VDAGKINLSPPSSSVLAVSRVGFRSRNIDRAVVVGVEYSGKDIHEVLEHVAGVLNIRVERAHILE